MSDIDRPIRIQAPDELRDGHLVVRPWTPEEVPSFHRLVVENLDHLRPFMPWAAAEAPTLEEYEALVERWREGIEAQTEWQVGIWLEDRPVGCTGLMQRRAHGTLEIGYWVGRSYTRRRVATTSSYLLTELAFGQDATERVEIWHDKANVGSRRVPEGLRFEFVDERPADPAAPSSPGEIGIDCVWRMSRQRWMDDRERPSRPHVREPDDLSTRP